jgi:hypothetical protein
MFLSATQRHEVKIRTLEGHGIAIRVVEPRAGRSKRPSVTFISLVFMVWILMEHGHFLKMANQLLDESLKANGLENERSLIQKERVRWINQNIAIVPIA